MRLETVSADGSATTCKYTVDGDRISQTLDDGVNPPETTTYVLDTAAPLTMVLAETTGTDTITYLHGLDLVAQSDGTSTEYFVNDGLGSVRQIVDAAGETLLAQTYDPYGSLYAAAGVDSTAFGYAGEQEDGNGLVFLRARYYSPSTGRFLNMDPSRQEMNPYVYGGNNPIMFTDPSGYCFTGNPAFDTFCWYVVATEATSAAAPVVVTVGPVIVAGVIVAGTIYFVFINPASGELLSDSCLALAEMASNALTEATGASAMIFAGDDPWAAYYWYKYKDKEENGESQSNGNGSDYSEPDFGQPEPNPGPNKIPPEIDELLKGKNFKQHYLSGKRALLEKALGKKYPKWKVDQGAAFLDDLYNMIDSGQLSYEGMGTLKKGFEAAHIYRGEGLTLVVKQNGEFWTLLKAGEGMDLGITMIP